MKARHSAAKRSAYLKSLHANSWIGTHNATTISNGIQGAIDGSRLSADISEPIRGDMVATISAWLGGTAQTCRHSPDPRTANAAFMAAWRPGLVTCGACAYALLKPRAGSEYLCDVCGTEPGSDSGEVYLAHPVGNAVFMAYGHRACISNESETAGSGN